MAQSQECSGHSLAGGFPHCEWMKPSVDGRPVECGLQFQSVDAFLTHTREHILMDSPAGVLGEGDGGNSLPLSCLWKNCGWQADQRSDLVVHILYHPYHSFLKHLGRGVVAKKSLPPCTYSSECCNILPELEGGFECLWDQCGEVFDSAWDFYEHVGGHVRGSAGNGQGGYKCMWQGNDVQLHAGRSNTHSWTYIIICTDMPHMHECVCAHTHTHHTHTHTSHTHTHTHHTHTHARTHTHITRTHITCTHITHTHTRAHTHHTHTHTHITHARTHTHTRMYADAYILHTPHKSCYAVGYTNLVFSESITLKHDQEVGPVTCQST